MLQSKREEWLEEQQITAFKFLQRLLLDANN
jgi:hypothetical protein